MTAWDPSLWDVVGSSYIAVVVTLPFVLPPFMVVRRLVKGSW